MNDWQTKAILAMIPVMMASAGWVMSLESRIQVIDARQQERTNRFDHLEQMMNLLTKEVANPAPKPETKVAMDGLRRDVDNLHEDLVRIGDRLNNLHNFIVQSPPYKPPPTGTGKRGDLYDTPLVYPQRNGAFP